MRHLRSHVMLATLVLSAALVATPPCTASPARQLLTVQAVSTATTHATVRLWSRAASGCWEPAGGPWRAHVGRSGLSANRHEGDGTTPLGTFGIGPVTYGLGPDPGLQSRFHTLRCGDWWDGDSDSPTYNRFRHVSCGERPRFGGNSEALWKQPVAYRYFAVIEFNTHPVVPGRGSAMFLHADTGGPTNGCVSLALPQLVRTLRWLDPRLHPVIEISAR
jgi:L,D-peptidoglycan transpeptidase YkuD (ErfK/YbiS/YcfS/YnhG family)